MPLPTAPNLNRSYLPLEAEVAMERRCRGALTTLGRPGEIALWMAEKRMPPIRKV